ncbi:MAG: thymidine kinase [Alphaproteobacteria bacterium]|nr:thymidine kinase [Alphaproteobacteria bacterium]
MAKLHFYYGVMSASKSAMLGINAFNFSRTGNKWEAIKPATDNRDSQTDIISRVGIRTHAHALKNLDKYTPKLDTQFILVDEVQFFAPRDIEKLVHIADNTNITIFCYGLKVDSNGDLFPASAKLLAEADELHPMETVCEMPCCSLMASHHIRFDSKGNIVRGGSQVEVGASQYKSVCRKHFHELYDNPNAKLFAYMRERNLQKTK